MGDGDQLMKRKTTPVNKLATDYTLSYLRFLSGFRASAPSARQYGITPEVAAEKRAAVHACLNRGVHYNKAS